jgi:competence protein ComEC
MFSFVTISLSITTQCKCLSLLVSALLLLLFQRLSIRCRFSAKLPCTLFFLCGFHLDQNNYLLPKLKLSNTVGLFSISIAANRDTSFKYLFFHQFPAYFFVTNLVVLPLLTFIMIGYSAVLASIDIATFLTVSLEIGIYG